MAQQLSLAARPRSLDQLVGQRKTVDAIRSHMAGSRTVKAWLFSGPRGTGKTSTARILALSLQCTHQTIFGKPCKECYRNKASFPIVEINASDITGIDRLRESLDGVNYGLLGNGRYRVYILDEVQKQSDSSQNLLLKHLEDTPDTTVFILCSTAPQKILEALRSRCVVYEMRELEPDDVPVLVTRLLKFAKSTLPVDRLADVLIERSIRSPRLIAQAVEKYIATEDPEQAAEVEGFTTVDVSGLCRSAVTGSWEDVSRILLNAQTVDIRGARLGVIAYLKAVLLASPDISERTNAVATAISLLCSLTNAEDLVVSAALAAELYRITALFAEYRL